jgi:hypothetical protein
LTAVKQAQDTLKKDTDALAARQKALQTAAAKPAAPKPAAPAATTTIAPAPKPAAPAAPKVVEGKKPNYLLYAGIAVAAVLAYRILRTK